MITLSKPDFLDLINWLKSKPKDGSYNYNNPWDCLLAQYLKAAGHENISIGTMNFNSKKTRYNTWPLPFPVNEISAGKGPEKLPANYEAWTYGDALQRAQDWMNELYPE